jgi:hypothetical protein
MDREINVAQINLQKSRAATSELVGQMLTNKISLALLEEKRSLLPKPSQRILEPPT